MSGHTWQDCARLRFTTPYQRCRLSAEGAWRRPIPGEERSNGQSCRWEQPTARMGEMYAGRPHGRDTTRRAASPGARPVCAPARCRSWGFELSRGHGECTEQAHRAPRFQAENRSTCCFLTVFARFGPNSWLAVFGYQPKTIAKCVLLYTEFLRREPGLLLNTPKTRLVTPDLEQYESFSDSNLRHRMEMK